MVAGIETGYRRKSSSREKSMFHFRMSLSTSGSHPGGYIFSGQLDVSLKLRQQARITHLGLSA